MKDIALFDEGEAPISLTSVVSQNLDLSASVAWGGRRRTTPKGNPSLLFSRGQNFAIKAWKYNLVILSFAIIIVFVGGVHYGSGKRGGRSEA